MSSHETASSAPTSVVPAAHAASPPGGVALPALLLGATAASVYLVGEQVWGNGWQLALPLLAILIAHELGHYVAARVHGERPTLPLFLPLPWFNPFGTLGALLFLDERSRSRRALLDIGAAGPLAGLLVALPLLALGLHLSPVDPLPASGYVQEGQSLLYWLAKRVLLGPLPAGHDVTMHPVLGAAWAGLYLTFLNLLPVGQLDGGHIAYALLGPRWASWSRWLLPLPSVLVAYNLLAFAVPVGDHPGGPAALASDTVVSAVLPWAVLQLLLLGMWWWTGLDHPDTKDGADLGPGRTAIGTLTLVAFLLLFMPSPWVVH